MTNAYAAQKPTSIERLVAVQKYGEIQLEKTGRAAFQNTIARDVALLENWLAEHALQKEIAFTAGDEDRYGRVQIISDVHEKMLRDGVVLIYASSGDIPSHWRQAEAQARTAKRGVWADESLMIMPETALNTTGGFYLVEGAITRIYESKTGTYLNFGNDWREDFSIHISPKLRRSMKAFLVSLNEGDRIRVRGGVIQENGPMIRLNHADNLEKL